MFGYVNVFAIQKTMRGQLENRLVIVVSRLIGKDPAAAIVFNQKAMLICQIVFKSAH